MDERQAKAAIALLAAYYPNKSMPDSTVIAWTTQLLPYHYEDARWAIEQIAASSRYMPSLADILAGIHSRRCESATPALAAPVSRLDDRVKEGLSPSDDGLAFLDARSDQRMRDQAMSYFRERRFETQPAAAVAWGKAVAALGEGATEREIASEVRRQEREEKARKATV